MVRYHPTKFVGHRHCASGDKMFLVVEKQDFKCLLKLPFFSKAHGMIAHGISC